MTANELSTKKKFLADEVEFQGSYDPKVLKTLYWAYQPFFFRILLLLTLGFLGRGLLLGNTTLIGLWVDKACVEDLCSGESLFVQNKIYFHYLIFSCVFGLALTLFFRIFFSRLSAVSVGRIYDEVTLRTSRYPFSFFDQTPVGRVMTRFSSDYGNVFRLFGGPLAEFISIIFDLIWMAVLILVSHPAFLVIIIFLILSHYIVYALNKRRLRQQRRDLSKVRGPGIAHFNETAQGAVIIRSFARQENFIQRFSKLDQTYLQQRMKTSLNIFFFSLQMNMLTAFSFLGTVLLSYFLITHQLISYGQIGVGFALIAMSGNTIQMFFEWMAQFEEAMVGLERMTDYLYHPLENGSLLPASTEFPTGHPVKKQVMKEPEILEGSVCFDNVWFRYRDDLPFVLKNLNFEIPAGQRWGIIGPTGSGKSSMIQSLYQFYPLTKGQILLDGTSAQYFEDLEAYRSKMAYISQESVLFRGTLRNNLDMAEQFSDQEIFQALIKVGLNEFADEQGLKRNIEERGKNLSLGEKQLLCMARCLLQKAPIIIMDEATSSVDPQSEAVMVKATEEFFHGRTQIIIAHRLSTLERCDQILWLENGEIKMIGNPSVVLPIFSQKHQDHPLSSPV